MTGDGLKELVVVTTRGVQVRCTLLITGYHGHFFINQTSYIRTKFCMAVVCGTCRCCKRTWPQLKKWHLRDWGPLYRPFPQAKRMNRNPSYDEPKGLKSCVIGTIKRFLCFVSVSLSVAWMVLVWEKHPESYYTLLGPKSLGQCMQSKAMC